VDRQLNYIIKEGLAVADQFLFIERKGKRELFLLHHLSLVPAEKEKKKRKMTGVVIHASGKDGEEGQNLWSLRGRKGILKYFFCNYFGETTLFFLYLP